MLEEHNEKNIVNSSDDELDDSDEIKEDDLDIDKGGLSKDVKKFEEIHSGDDSEEFDEVRKKKKSEKGKSSNKVENLESLKVKRVDLQQQKRVLEQKLSKFDNKVVSVNEGDDEFESYMKSISNSLSNEEKSNLQNELDNLNNEIDRVEKLIEFVTPTLDKIQIKKQETQRKETTETKNNENVQKKLPQVVKEDVDNLFNEESEKKTSSLPLFTSSTLPKTSDEKKKKKKRKVKGPSKEELLGANVHHYEEEDEQKYSNWVAPKGQTGDGMTELNK